MPEKHLELKQCYPAWLIICIQDDIPVTMQRSKRYRWSVRVGKEAIEAIQSRCVPASFDYS